MDSTTFSSNRPADVAAVKEYAGIGELIVGGSNATILTFTALCMLNHPQINQYFLDNSVKFSDRLTKTVIFPREGMALPNGEFYKTAEDSKC